MAVRLAQYVALLSLFGLAAFAVYAPAAYRQTARRDPMIPIILAALLASFAGIFDLAARMSGDIASAADPATLLAVIGQTAAGWAWSLRLAALAAALVAAAMHRPFLLLVFSSAALASLAWAGHAAAESGSLGWVHLAADVLHLWAAGVWVGALIAFARLITRGKADLTTTGEALARFSGIGSLLVATLIATGLVNVWRMVDWRPLPVLTVSLWGWLLIVKVAVFVAMLCLAAANRFWLTPRLQGAVEGGAPSTAHLRLSLIVETTLAFGVLGLVSVLGTLSPHGGA